MAKDAAAAARKWAANYGASAQSMKEGAMAVQQSPTQKAAQNTALMLANYQESINSGRYQQAASKVSAEDWKQAYITKGIPTATGRAQASLPAVQAALNKIVPAAQQIAASLPPRGNLQQNLQRAAAQATAMANLKGTLGAK